MYEIRQSKQLIGRIEIVTWIEEILNANILEVEVGTNGYQGGDTGHGGRTYFRLKDLGGTDIEVKTGKDKHGCTELIIELGGDAELSTFIESLEFAIKVLKEQSSQA